MEHLIKSLRSKGIYISYVENSLKINFDGDEIPADVLQELKEHKQQLIDYLKLIGKDNDYVAIPKAASAEKYPLSSSQKRLWIVSQIKQASVAYNMPFSVPLSSDFSDKNVLEKSIQYLIERHESLRTVFKLEDDGEVYQYIIPAEDFNFQMDYRDFSNEENTEKALQNYRKQDALTAFDLENGPLFRICFFKLSEEAYHLYYNLHHIITDEWSMEVLMKDILKSYEAFKRNELPELPELKIQYKDYATWQRSQLEGNGFNESGNYWKTHLSGELQTLNLPTENLRPKSKTYNGNVLTAYLKKETSERIREAIQQRGGSPFMLLMSVFKSLCYRYTGQTDLLIGSPIAGRDHADLENQIGFYLNTIVLRNQVDSNGTFGDFYEEVKKNVLNAYSHQAYPFDKLVEEINVKRDVSRNAVFDVLLDYHKSFSLTIEDERLGTIEQSEAKPVKYDIELHFSECENTLGISFHYNTDIYEEAMIRQFMTHYAHFLDHLEANFDKNINETILLSEAEQTAFIQTLNNTLVTLDANETVVDHLAKQQQSIPLQAAIISEENTLSYEQFASEVTKLASFLQQEYNIQKGDRIGIKMENSEHIPIALQAILKAGGVFVPIDPKYTSEREQFIIEDSQMKLMITTTDFMFDFMEYDLEILTVDIEYLPENFEIKALPSILPTDDAYIIYTSGSTGTPKGVLVGHESLLNYLLWAKETYVQPQATPIFGLFTSICFDLTITSLFLPIVAGGSLHILDSRKDVTNNLQTYIETGISTIKLTPAHISVLGSLNVQSEALQVAIVGGDALSNHQVAILKDINPDIKIYNEYGPTEATVGCIVKEIKSADEKIYIGTPIANTQVYILNEHHQLVPKGVSGEICIGGKGLAKGYVNTVELTNEKFITNPFNSSEKIYKTGDIASWSFDNELDFKGRKDHQVKIKGFRIELGEIEYHLHQHENIKEATVIVNDSEAEKTLEAYIVGNTELNVKDIRGFLANKLPEYMIPQYYHQLEVLPLTNNGKVDRKALQQINNKIKTDEEVFVAASTPTEETIVSIWKEEFGLEAISVTTSFFDLGGDSIRAIRVLSKINKVLQTKLDVADIFEAPSIQELAAKQKVSQSLYSDEEKEAIIATFETYKNDFIADESIEDAYPMSDIEIGMCYNYIINREQSVYHDQFLYPIYIPVFDLERFNRALNLMVAKHDILRTSYNIDTYKTPLRFIHKSLEVSAAYEDISHLTKDAQSTYVNDFMTTERKEVPFEITKPGLWRMKIFKLNAEEQILLFQFHHAILDGWSRASLITELNNIYFKLTENEAFAPEVLPMTYKDYVIDQECLKQSNALLSYWEETLHDYKRLDCFSTEIEHESTKLHLTDATFDKLETFAATHQISTRAICFAAYMFTLRSLSYNTDILTGLVTNGRLLETHGDEVLGCFLNTTPYRYNGTNDTLLSFTKNIDEKLNIQKRYERLSLAELNRRFGKDENRHNPFFDSLFIYVDFHIYKKAEKSVDEMASKDERILDVSRFELNNTYLDVLVSPTDDGMVVEWNRSRKLVSGLTNKELTEIYMSFIQNILKDETKSIAAVADLLADSQLESIQKVNDTKLAHDASETFVTKFAKHVAETPQSDALTFNGNTYTYQELDEKSNQFANYLIQEHGVQAGNLVAVHLPRTEALIMSLLAIVKAGAGYIPLDITYPQHRIDFIEKDTEYVLRISTEVIADFEAKQAHISTDAPTGIEVSPSSIAYIIYTSGSTGNPKGVVLEHKNLNAFVNTIDAQLDFENATRIGAVTNTSFDVSVVEIFGALAHGKQIILFGDEQLSDTEKFMQTLIDEKVHVLQITPTRLSMIKEYLYDVPVGELQHLIVAGEAFHNDVHENLARLSYLNIRNAYGPTEATVYATQEKLTPQTELTIGKPLQNVEIFVVNQNNEVLPMGVTGEICIAGEGVAREYLNLPELTAQSFVTHPFKENERMYKTGDIGYWNADNNLVHLGRIDHQVKVNGHRIELGEIESALLTKETIEKAIVLIRKTTDNSNELVAYIVSSGEENSKELREHLLQQVPQYMVPSHFIAVEQIPLLISGKADRKALQAMHGDQIASDVAYEAPETDVEIKLAEIWATLLNKEKIGVNDDFFVLGGNSLKAISFINQLNHNFDVEVKLADFFRYATIRELATHIQNKQWLAENTASENEVII
ncbi:surfactin family lipopeptide synthetase A [Kordia periserrulae]|uniref:Surfactin family lipopeptide synthetase A n=1 Tax=Kordia periserrulae TaxID=701523 RepID=A0A2T6BZ85_9FLAO|nr:non-ribosomal peptide synthetase [Kordia periserrulae]PTX61366.1 surfactin family lipopeptide synthetase A [Kordia periserrulae]